jgi:hypothetical protein
LLLILLTTEIERKATTAIRNIIIIFKKRFAVDFFASELFSGLPGREISFT